MEETTQNVDENALIRNVPCVGFPLLVPKRTTAQHKVETLMRQCKYIGRIGNHKNISMYVLNIGKIRKYNIYHFVPPLGKAAYCVPFCPQC